MCIYVRIIICFGYVFVLSLTGMHSPTTDYNAFLWPLAFITNCVCLVSRNIFVDRSSCKDF